MGTPVSGSDADVYVVANPSVNTTNETCDNTDGGTWITYKAHTHFYWDKRQTLTIQCSPNGSSGWSVVTDYVFEYAGGVVVFNTARVAGVNNFVRIQTGYYWTLSQCGDCNDWSLALDVDTADTTTFQSAWRLKTPTVAGGSAKISSFRVDGLLAAELSNLMVLVLYSDKSANTRWEMNAYITSIGPKSSATGVVEQDANFAIEGKAYFRAS